MQILHNYQLILKVNNNRMYKYSKNNAKIKVKDLHQLIIKINKLIQCKIKLQKILNFFKNLQPNNVCVRNKFNPKKS